MVVGPTVPIDLIEPITKNFNAKLIVVKDDQMFVNVNNNISLALYKEIMKDREEIPNPLNEEGIKEALKIAQPCRLEMVPSKIIQEFAPGLDYYPIATYFDIASNPQGIKKVTSAIRLIHEKGTRLKIYMLFSFKKPADLIPPLHIYTMYMNSHDIKFIIVKHNRLIKYEDALKVVKKVKMSGTDNVYSTLIFQIIIISICAFTYLNHVFRNPRSLET